MRTLARAALALAAVVVLVLVAVVAFTPHRCFLDVLNAQIAKSTSFEAFYAGHGGLMTTREFLPELGDLEDAFPTVRGEALAVFEDHLGALVEGGAVIPRMDATYNRIFTPKGAEGPLAKVNYAVSNAFSKVVYGADVDTFTKIGSDRWRTFNLVVFDREVPGNADRCPELVRLLKRVPGMQSAMISIVAPGGRIPPHSDPAKGVIRYHLAFKTPKDRENCFIEIVDGAGVAHRYAWKEGEGVVFDDAFVHQVQNNTDEYRVILFVDLLRPMTGVPGALQGVANLANRFHPGVRRLIKASRV